MAKLKRVGSAQQQPNSPKEFADTFGHSTGAPEGRMIDMKARRGDVPATAVVIPAIAPARTCLICKFRRPALQVKEVGDA